MNHLIHGCQGAAKLRTPTWEEKECPQCGNMIEIFSCDLQMACEKCGFVRGCSYIADKGQPDGAAF